MLALDRYLGFHFFTNEAGGNMMMFINLIQVRVPTQLNPHAFLVGS